MIAVAFALEFEGAVFTAQQSRDARMCVSSWFLGATGKEAAQGLRRKLEETRVKLVISAGFAGGLQPELAVGDLVLGANYSDEVLRDRLILSDKWRRGNVETVEAIIERSDEKRRLGEATGGLVGDLETSHMAEVCREKGVRMLSIRCISDALDDDMPVPAKVLLNPQTSRPDSLALFRHLIANPSSVMGFNKLIKNAKTAQASLARGLEEILPQALKF